MERQSTGARIVVRVGAALVLLATLASSPPALAFAHERNVGTTARQTAKLRASDGAQYAYFGHAVALSGASALIGARGANNSTGAAYVFTRANGVWSQQAELAASDGLPYDLFGISVALQGSTAVVGSMRDTGAGAVYVFTRSGTTWSQQAELTASDGVALDQFGISLALSASGSQLVIGANGKNNGAGAAYVFTRSGTTWSQQAELTGSIGQFGASVALSGTTLVVGAPSANSFKGEADVFVGSGATWSEQATLAAPADAVYFGTSVGASGSIALIGAPASGANSSGAAYVFVQSGTQWTEQAELLASDPGYDDGLGTAVALAGSVALVGAPYWQNMASVGAAYEFVQSGTVWTQQAELTASDGASSDYFAGAVAIGGSNALIGSWGKKTDTGAAYVFAGL